MKLIQTKNGIKKMTDEEAKEYFAKDEPVKTYKELRVYPSIQDQLDMIYWDKINETNKWEEAITKVKTDFPKTQGE